MISVIIPTFNEVATIGETIQKVKKNASDGAAKIPYEIIVVDSSSDDRTVKEAKRENATILTSDKGRGKQMNLGARNAKGDILLFLHSDVILPWNWNIKVSNAISQGFDYGGFTKRFETQSRVVKIFSLYLEIKKQLLYELVGEDGLFVKRSIFLGLGGFKEIDLMEDIEFSKRLKKYNMKLIKDHLVISDRRFERNGALKTIMIMTYLRFIYFLGADPKNFANIYTDTRGP